MVENIVPGWVAPNLITLVAYSFLVFAHLVLIWYSPDMNT
jgi:ethanolaminephosphotransferase